jgi:hypothetical protein
VGEEGQRTRRDDLLVGDARIAGKLHEVVEYTTAAHKFMS